MNYQPRQREGDKKWDFTCHNKRTGTRPVGKCADKTCNHDTEGEAQECYRQWLLDTKLDIEGTEFSKPWLECEVEGAATTTPTCRCGSGSTTSSSCARPIGQRSRSARC